MATTGELLEIDLSQNRSEDVAKRLQATLDRHGYGFQYAVVRIADELHREGRSPWRLPVTEFPVEVNGHVTRADIIFEHFHGSKLLVCECKRTNSALSDWCFLNVPSHLIAGSNAGVSYERIVRSPDGVKSSPGEPSYPADVYQMAVEVRSQEKGDNVGQGRGVIEEAATQVLRSLNGLANYFCARPDHIASRNGWLTLIPVIFTTARLWVSKSDLSMADLATGMGALSERDLESRDYLVYTYPLSSNLRHTVESLPGQRERVLPPHLGEVLYREYMRAIVVVSATGIEKYLASESFY